MPLFLHYPYVEIIRAYFNRDEKKTRNKLTDPALHKAGWDVSNSEQVGIEIPVDDFDPGAWDKLRGELVQIRERGGNYPTELPTGISDYVLYQPNGDIIAVVEAKKTSIDPRLAQVQTAFYVTEIEKRQSFRPFGFMTNGEEIYFWDVGRSPKRLVHGFFSPRDLENLRHIREHQTPLTDATINLEITDRAYQQEAIQYESDPSREALRDLCLSPGITNASPPSSRIASNRETVFPAFKKMGHAPPATSSA